MTLNTKWGRDRLRRGGDGGGGRILEKYEVIRNGLGRDGCLGWRWRMEGGGSGGGLIRRES